jgi:nicotinamidase-related amidase
LPGARIIACRMAGLDAGFKDAAQVIIEKTDYDATTNPHFFDVVRTLGATRLIALGVATDYCVLQTVLSVLRSGLTVDLVTDAIQGINEQTSGDALAQIAAAGGRAVTTAQVLAEFEPAIAP